MAVAGECFCNGHGDGCLPGDEEKCSCKHNTDGWNCEYCLEGYNDVPWQAATSDNENECKSEKRNNLSSFI